MIGAALYELESNRVQQPVHAAHVVPEYPELRLVRRWSFEYECHVYEAAP